MLIDVIKLEKTYVTFQKTIIKAIVLDLNFTEQILEAYQELILVKIVDSLV